MAEDIERLLGSFGITGYSAQALLFLLKNGEPADAKGICEGASIPLPRIYSIMNGLERAGVIRRMPGKVQRFSALGSKEVVETLSSHKVAALKKSIQNVASETSTLQDEISKVTRGKVPSLRTVVEYYTSAQAREFFETARRSEFNIKTRRILFSSRFMLGYTDEEIAKNPPVRGYFEGAIKRFQKGLQTRYVCNPRSAMERTIIELGSKDKLVESVIKTLGIFYKYRKLIRTSITYDISNLTMDVTDELVSIEFWHQPGGEFTSAIIIRDKGIAKDFAKWFDGFFVHEMGADENFKMLKLELERQLEELYGIKKQVIEERLKKVGIRL